jgi:LPS-assembly protein
VSAILPINERWKLMGRWQYDMYNNRAADQMIGFEYDSCCWKTQMLLRDYTEQLFDGSLRKDVGLFVYFELKGLGGSGGSLQNVLGENIYGYRPIEQEQRLSGW